MGARVKNKGRPRPAGHVHNTTKAPFDALVPDLRVVAQRPQRRLVAAKGARANDA
jgi:hypothetical protein